MIRVRCNSVISEEYFNSLHIPNYALKTQADSYMVAANQSPMNQLGSIDLSVSIQGLTIPYTFVVLRTRLVV